MHTCSGYYLVLATVILNLVCTRVHPTASYIACMMHSKSKISKSISRYKLSRRFYDLVTILLGYKARCCALRCALNHLSTVMYKSDTAAKRCATRCPGCGSPAAAPRLRLQALAEHALQAVATQLDRRLDLSGRAHGVRLPTGAFWTRGASLTI